MSFKLKNDLIFKIDEQRREDTGALLSYTSKNLYPFLRIFSTPENEKSKFRHDLTIERRTQIQEGVLKLSCNKFEKWSYRISVSRSSWILIPKHVSILNMISFFHIGLEKRGKCWYRILTNFEKILVMALGIDFFAILDAKNEYYFIFDSRA